MKVEFQWHDTKAQANLQTQRLVAHALMRAASRLISTLVPKPAPKSNNVTQYEQDDYFRQNA